MKKLIGLLLALVLLSPLGVKAQEPTNAELLSIIQNLMTQVLALMEKLKEIEAAQATQGQVLGSVQSSVTILNSNTAKATLPVTSVIFGEAYCTPDKGGTRIPITISGPWKSAKALIDYGNGEWRGSEFSNGGDTILFARAVVGTYPIRVDVSINEGTSLYNQNPKVDFSQSGSVSIPTCQ